MTLLDITKTNIAYEIFSIIQYGGNKSGCLNSHISCSHEPKFILNSNVNGSNPAVRFMVGEALTHFESDVQIY